MAMLAHFIVSLPHRESCGDNVHESNTTSSAARLAREGKGTGSSERTKQ